MSSIALTTACPAKQCPNKGVVKQWYKADCGHKAYIDTDVDVFCQSKCKWKGIDRTHADIVSLYWNCNDCKCGPKQYGPEALCASLAKAMAALVKANKFNESAVFAAIIDKIADRMCDDQNLHRLSKCLILSMCIEDYKNPDANRKGCEQDVQNIANACKWRGYTMKQNQHKHVDSTEYVQLINDAKQELIANGKKYDAFIFVFSGHGDSHPGCKYSSVICLSPDDGCTDGVEVPVKEIMDAFRNGVNGLGKAFLNKPRFFFIQACRGSNAVVPIQDDDDEKEAHDGDINKVLYHPDKNMYLLQSNTAGYKSYRDTKNGSYLITALCRELIEKKDLSLEDLEFQIKRKVEQDSKSKQTCAVTQTLAYKSSQIIFMSSK